mgnify:CR=1 FL=1
MRTFNATDRQMPQLFTEILYAIGIQIADVRVLDDGIIEFHRRWITHRIAASDIDLVEIRWTTDEYDKDSCHLYIWHGSRNVVTPCFPHADEFLDQLTRLNPAMHIDGSLYTGERC